MLNRILCERHYMPVQWQKKGYREPNWPGTFCRDISYTFFLLDSVWLLLAVCFGGRRFFGHIFGHIFGQIFIYEKRKIEKAIFASLEILVGS